MRARSHVLFALVYASWINGSPYNRAYGVYEHFTKSINSFNHTFSWSNESCDIIMSETRLFPPTVCGYDQDKVYKDLAAVPRILITGSARSGTTMIAKLISSIFFPFSNDANSPTEFGISSWRLAGPTTHNLYRFRFIFHQVMIAPELILSSIFCAGS